MRLFHFASLNPFLNLNQCNGCDFGHHRAALLHLFGKQGSRQELIKLLHILSLPYADLSAFEDYLYEELISEGMLSCKLTKLFWEDINVDLGELRMLCQITRPLLKLGNAIKFLAQLGPASCRVRVVGRDLNTTILLASLPLNVICDLFNHIC